MLPFNANYPYSSIIFLGVYAHLSFVGVYVQWVILVTNGNLSVLRRYSFNETNYW